MLKIMTTISKFYQIMNFKYGFLFFLTLLFINNDRVSAQNNIRGKVFSPESFQGEEQFIPLPGASVSWKGTRHGTITDLNGFFKLSLSQIGKGDTLQVSMIGYETIGLVYLGQKYVEIPLRPGVEVDVAEVETQSSGTSISLLDPLNIQQLNRKELAKAACCNLSMAFETNASIDASFTDAVTGTKQIRMLGLDGKYAQILVDNLPGPRGLNIVNGLSFVPGPWIDAIAISKGAGSVTNGYESITGQINVLMRNPENSDPIHINLYRGGDGRTEWNHISKHKVSRRWSTTILSHAEYIKTLNDRNLDSFLDFPLKKDLILRNEWKYMGDRGIRGEYSITSIQMKNMAGQKPVFENNTENPFDFFNSLLENDSDSLWTAAKKINRVELSAKTGYVFPDKEWKSIGSQFYASRHQHDHKFGNRSYSGTENFLRGNLLFSSIIGNTDHAFTTGASILYDDFNEVGTWAAESDNWDEIADTMTRTEVVPGAFFEYTWTAGERLQTVAGLRADFHNLYGTFASPRLHVRYSLAEEISLKFAYGRGFRTANVFMEQLGTWASNRRWIVEDGLLPEMATNLGLNLVSKFKLNSRDASFSIDGYYTNFDNRVVADLYHSSNSIVVYNLTNSQSGNTSYSTTLQAEFDWSAHRRLDIRAAYRWVDAKTDYLGNGLVRDPFVAQHRAFTQWSYASKLGPDGQQLRIDGVLQWVGAQAMPTPTIDSPSHTETSPDFTQINLQVSQTFKGNFEIYAGVENLLGFVHDNPIVGAIRTIEGPELNPQFNDVFDASLVYGPIFGRMTYAGLRWTLGTADAQ